LQEYLECGRPLENSKITALSFSREMDVKMTKELNEVFEIHVPDWPLSSEVLELRFLATV